MMDERKQILEMLASGKISVDEAARLLEAVEGPAAANQGTELPAGVSAQPAGKARYIRVRVTENGKQKVNINIPIGLAKAGMGIAKAGMKIASRSGGHHQEDLKELENIDFDEIIRQIELGTSGKIVDVQEDNSLVEVYVE